ncbi:MAG: hypothetical protein HY506_01875 [Candidatus Yanofskybacteria bacterium]|nr:hypothetical protein [Candidatus Yanofskybacteria bacterium]
MDTQIKKADSTGSIRGTPKDVFLHLLAVVTLYVSVIAFIALWWQYVNLIFPDLLQYQGYGYYGSAYDPIRIAMSALIVVFPVHIVISWLIGREFKADPEKREMRVRKWLWYITLFVSAVTILVDLIILVNNFLKGELSTQFFLKILVVLVAAAAVFGYYLWDLRKHEKQSKKPKFVAWITAAVLLASIIYGFFLIGLPSSQRARRFDEQRVNNLSAIQGQITYLWQRTGKLPASLDDLRDGMSGFVPPVDPETNQSYEYVVTGPLKFSLCANFNASSSPKDISNGRKPIAVPMYDYGQIWDHESGRVCFERTIDPLLYPRTTDLPIKPPINY